MLEGEGARQREKSPWQRDRAPRAGAPRAFGGARPWPPRSPGALPALGSPQNAPATARPIVCNALKTSQLVEQEQTNK